MFPCTKGYSWIIEKAFEAKQNNFLKALDGYKKKGVQGNCGI